MSASSSSGSWDPRGRVAPVMGEVLRHEIDLLRALLSSSCASRISRRADRAVLAAHQRNGAERAAMVASFADLQIANVRQFARVSGERPDEPRRSISQQAALGEGAVPSSRDPEPEKEIDLGKFAFELVARGAGPCSRRRPPP